MARTRYRSSTAPTPWQKPPAAALRAVLQEGYTGTDFRHDLLAGTVVGIVALPLSMALAIAVGAPPQAGLYTAIVAGFVVALLGGSRTQVTGPTAAFVVIQAPIYARFGLPGLLVSGLLAGVILVAMGLFRRGRFIEFIPYPVTTGFTAGIGTVIAVLQLKDLLGLKLQGNPEQFLDRVWAMVSALPTLSLPEVAIGALTLACLLVWPRIVRRVPAALVALNEAAGRAKVLILRMGQVPAIDATGLVALESALESLKRQQTLAIVTGLREQPRRVLANAGIIECEGCLVVRDDIESALEAAERHIAAAHRRTGGRGPTLALRAARHPLK